MLSVCSVISYFNSIGVNIAYILHETIYFIFAYYMRTVQSNFRNLIIASSLHSTRDWQVPCNTCESVAHEGPEAYWDKRNINPFLPTVQTFAVRETDVSRHNGGTEGAPLKPLRDDSAMRALSSLKCLRGGTRGAPIMPRDVSLSDSKCWNGGQK